MRKTSIVVIPLALLLFLAVTAGRGSSANQEEPLARVVAALRGQLDELSTRMERLEQATDSYYPGLSDTDTPQGTAARGRRSMVVAGIQPSEHTEDYSVEIQQLRREIQSLERTIDSQRRRVSNLEGSRSGGSARRRIESQVAAQRRLLNQYQRGLGRKRQELRRLEQASGAPKQIVVGHDGDVILFLHTEVDLSASLGDVSIGDAVTWRGRRMEMEQGSETWVVERIRKVRSDR